MKETPSPTEISVVPNQGWLDKFKKFLHGSKETIGAAAQAIGEGQKAAGITSIDDALRNPVAVGESMKQAAAKATQSTSPSIPTK